MPNPQNDEKDEEEPRDLLAEEAAAIMSGLEINDSVGAAVAEVSDEAGDDKQPLPAEGDDDELVNEPEGDLEE